VQGKIVTCHATGSPRANHFCHGCRAAATCRQRLAFFSKKLNPAQQKYSAYDRELLAVYEAVKHFRHMLEARHFIIFADHKPITYGFQQKRDKCSLITLISSLS
jgi:hypothetical protein